MLKINSEKFQINIEKSIVFPYTINVVAAAANIQSLIQELGPHAIVWP